MPKPRMRGGHEGMRTLSSHLPDDSAPTCPPLVRMAACSDLRGHLHRRTQLLAQPYLLSTCSVLAHARTLITC